MRITMSIGWFVLTAILIGFAVKYFAEALHTEYAFGLLWAAVIMTIFLAAAFANATKTSLPD